MISILFEKVEMSGGQWVAVPGWAASRDWPSVPAKGDRVQLRNDLDESDPLLGKVPPYTYMRAVDRLWCDDGSVLVRVVSPSDKPST